MNAKDAAVTDHKGPASTFFAKTVTGPAIYHFGIIDFLQNWTFQKKIERAMKIYFFRKDPDGLSVMHPQQYKTRFQNKLDQIFDLEGASGGIGKVDLTPSTEEHAHDSLVEEEFNDIEMLTNSYEIGSPLQDKEYEEEDEGQL
jgi:hypothetical protein